MGNVDLFAACVACLPSLTRFFLSSFSINRSGLCFRFFSDLLTSEPGDKSNIYSTATEVGGAIPEFTLNSPSTSTYGPFTNTFYFYSSCNCPHFFTSEQQQSATNVTTTGDNRHNNRQQSSVIQDLKATEMSFGKALSIQREMLKSNPPDADQVLLSVASTQCNTLITLEDAMMVQQSVLGDTHFFFIAEAPATA
jgi:hypothetical protein